MPDTDARATAEARTTLRQQAATGVLLVAGRNFAVRLIGFAGTVALARMLDPRDFGVIALSFTAIVIAHLLTDGGLVSTLIRRDATPTRHELGCVLTTQLVISSTLAAVVGASGLAIGAEGHVAVLMAASVPITVFRIPSAVMAERELQYGLLTRVEIAEVVVYNVAAVALVAAGSGLVGVGAAVVLQAVAGTVLMIRAGATGVVRPRVDLRTSIALLRSGLSYQALSITTAFRDQGINVVVGAIGGVAVLGIWALASRLLAVILSVLQALWRVSFPTMAALQRSGEDLAPIAAQALRLSAVAIGLPVAVLAGSAPVLVASIFGERWTDAAPVLAWGAAALMVSGPVSTALIGLMLALGEARVVLVAVLLEAGTHLLLLPVLVPLLDAEGVGVSMLAAGIVSTWWLCRWTGRRWPGTRFFRPVIAPGAVAAVSAAVGWGLASALPATIAMLVVTALVICCIYLGLTWIFRRTELMSLCRIATRSVTAKA